MHYVEISPYHNFTPPMHSGERTAILLTGQLRSGNMSWFSSELAREGSPPWRFRFFNEEDPDTPIQTILERLVIPYALFGGVDMFIYIQVNRKHMSSSYG